MISRMVRRAAVALGVVVAVGSVPVGQAAAESLKPPVIAVVDVQLILQDSSAGKSIQKAIDGQRDFYTREIGAQEEKLREAEQELGRQRSVLSEEAFAKKRRDFEKQIADVQRDVQARKRAIDQSFNEAMRTVQGSLLEIIAGLAQERGVNLVLYKHQVVIVEKNMELTQEVLERLNKKLPSVTVKIPSKK